MKSLVMSPQLLFYLQHGGSSSSSMRERIRSTSPVCQWHRDVSDSFRGGLAFFCGGGVCVWCLNLISCHTWSQSTPVFPDVCAGKQAAGQGTGEYESPPALFRWVNQTTREIMVSVFVVPCPPLTPPAFWRDCWNLRNLLSALWSTESSYQLSA